MNATPPSSGPMRSETPEPPGTLMDKLQAVKFEWVEDTNRWIIPAPWLERLVSIRNVRTELTRIFSSSPLSKDNLQSYTSAICMGGRKKLFAILIYGWGEMSGYCKTILDLVDDGITDSQLPFERIHLTGKESGSWHSQNSYKLCIKGHAKCKTSDHGCVVKALQNWSQKDIDDFFRIQWMVLAPVFRVSGDDITHFDLDHRMLLPFTEDKEGDGPIPGGYSEVWQIQICDGHQNFYTPFNTEVKF
jgi:hypothetical protein